jgi:hypothetical protein
VKAESIEGYFVGFADLTISEVAKHFPEFFGGFSALVTCLDSGTELKGYGRRLQLAHPEWALETINESIWVDGSHVAEFLATRGVLTHFDEMYFLKAKPTAVSVEEIFTTDRPNFAEKIPSSFVPTMWRFEATRYLADGCGLNFACEDFVFAQRIEQIESTVAKS